MGFSHPAPLCLHQQNSISLSSALRSKLFESTAAQQLMSYKTGVPSRARPFPGPVCLRKPGFCLLRSLGTPLGRFLLASAPAAHTLTPSVRGTYFFLSGLAPFLQISYSSGQRKKPCMCRTQKNISALSIIYTNPNGRRFTARREVVGLIKQEVCLEILMPSNSNHFLREPAENLRKTPPV